MPVGSNRAILRQLGLTEAGLEGRPMRYAYPVDVHEAADGVTVTCLDVPELVTGGETRAEALERAADALVTAQSYYVDDGKPLPGPSAANGRPVNYQVTASRIYAGRTSPHMGTATALFMQ